MDGPAPLYDRDFVAWTADQATRLRAEAQRRPHSGLDYAHLAEEVEAMGESERRAVVSLLALVIEHALKLEHAPERGPRRHWALSVRKCQRQVNRRLARSPSLRAPLDTLVGEAYTDGRFAAAAGLALAEDDLPPVCVYATADLLDETWLPASRWDGEDGDA